jgi:mannosyltransferase OCH1-like enzyme
MFPRIRIPSTVTSNLPIPMLRQSPNFLVLALVLSTITGSVIYTVFQSSNWPWYYHFCPKPTPNYLAASSQTETICSPAAKYLDPRVLISSIPSTSAGSSRRGSIEREISGGVPKIIHQSWMDGNLPVKFSKWSDSLRVRHPDWSWVRVPSLLWKGS